MKYRHVHHAGNFADVHKHTVLLALLQALQRKDKGLLYVDTHAGAGAYDLSSPEARRGAEARHGVLALLSAEVRAPEILAYRDAVIAWRQASGRTHGYPGSPLLIAQALRAQDRGLCCEWLPQECRALQGNLGGFRRMRVECADGYQRLTAALPPRERRALILIDPPYESPEQEMRDAIDAVAAALARLANAVLALWYPIKDERWLARWQTRLTGALSVTALRLELWLYPRDARAALNGSGLLVINPPYQFAERASQWQPELAALLDERGLGGQAVNYLIEESSRHEHA
jgi:23S rRNA (adenine2030-N6)-methyltransferase